MSRAARLAKLEQQHDPAAMPFLTMSVIDSPTPKQQATIDQCTRTGRRLVVFVDHGDTAWMPGLGAPPWEIAP